MNERATWRRDPLLWVVAAVPIGLLTRQVGIADRWPTGVGEWLFVAVYTLVVSAFVAVVLIGVRRGWQLVRTGPGSAADRDARRARSAAVAQTIVGAATLLLLVGAILAWALYAFLS